MKKHFVVGKIRCGKRGELTMKALRPMSTAELYATETDTFLEFQRKRNAELRDLVKRKRAGEYIDPTPHIQFLREAGILDENNTLSERYRPKDWKA